MAIKRCIVIHFVSVTPVTDAWRIRCTLVLVQHCLLFLGLSWMRLSPNHGVKLFTNTVPAYDMCQTRRDMHDLSRTDIIMGGAFLPCAPMHLGSHKMSA